MLAVALRVLLRLHADVFTALEAQRGPPPGLPASVAGDEGQAGGDDEAGPSWDARRALSRARRRVLAGVRLVFSHVIPLGAPPAAHPLWRLAERFGAVCCLGMEPGVTHVVAAAAGTEKVAAAVAAGKHVVSPAWLQCSCTLWARADEGAFPCRA